jgi:hypothetical protein
VVVKSVVAEMQQAKTVSPGDAKTGALLLPHAGEAQYRFHQCSGDGALLIGTDSVTP